MTKAKRQWLIWLALTAISPMVYALIQGSVLAVLLPILSGFKLSNGTLITAIIVAADVVGSLIVFLCLALPLGYITREKYFLFGALLGAGLVAILFVSAITQAGFHSYYLVFITSLQYAGIMISAIAGAKLGFQLRAACDAATVNGLR